MGLKTVFIALVIVCLAFVIFLILGLPNISTYEDYKVLEISSKKLGAKLYIKKKTWGLTADNQIVIISSSNESKFSADTDNDYIFKGLSPLFYKVQNDSLLIYGHKSSTIPRNLKTPFRIIQIE